MVPTMSSTSDAGAMEATESTPEETGAALAFSLALPLGFALQADATAAAFF